MEWMRIEYNMPNMGPHWHDGAKTQKEVLSGRWKEHHEVFIPEYVAEEYEDFNDGVLMYTNGGLMDEINENLKNCPTYDDRVRYIISLLQSFKEFAAAFYAKEQIDERKRAIVECQKDMKSWENVAEDAVDERTGKLLEPAKQIEACKQFIDKYEQDIKYWKQVEEDFFWLAQHGLGAGHYRTFRCEVNDEMCKYLGGWWRLMITFSRRLAAVGEGLVECVRRMLPTVDITLTVHGPLMDTYLKAEVQSGIDILLDIARFDELIQKADIVITGEGKSDAQTMMGKVPCGVQKRCMKAAVPIWLLSGAIDDTGSILSSHFDRVHSINENDLRPLVQLLQPEVAKENICKTVARLMECENET